jgi:hypothetical protein
MAITTSSSISVKPTLFPFIAFISHHPLNGFCSSHLACYFSTRLTNDFPFTSPPSQLNLHPFPQLSVAQQSQHCLPVNSSHQALSNVLRANSSKRKTHPTQNRSWEDEHMMSLIFVSLLYQTAVINPLPA